MTDMTDMTDMTPLVPDETMEHKNTKLTLYTLTSTFEVEIGISPDTTVADVLLALETQYPERTKFVKTLKRPWIEPEFPIQFWRPLRSLFAADKIYPHVYPEGGALHHIKHWRLIGHNC